MAYWLVLSGYAYGLGLGLRLITPFLDALIFMLLVVASIIMVPILMLLGVVLYAFPDASPTIWRDIRVPFGCFWFGVVMQIWFLPDANFYEDYTHPMVAPLSTIFRVSPTVCHYVLAIVFFSLCAISYGRILVVVAVATCWGTGSPRLSGWPYLVVGGIVDSHSHRHRLLIPNASAVEGDALGDRNPRAFEFGVPPVSHP